MAHTATDELELLEVGGSGRRPGGPRDVGFDDRGGAPAVPQRIYLTGVVLGLAAVLMFFLALASAYIVRQGLSGDWMTLGLPRILWFNTAVLVVSSLTAEWARSALREGRAGAFGGWWAVTSVLGVLFLIGQVIAWRELAARGIYVESNPSSSFFFLLTGAHGLHLLGGVVGLLFVGFRTPAPDARVSRPVAVTAASIYWHFMGLLWILILLLLQLGR